MATTSSTKKTTTKTTSTRSTASKAKATASKAAASATTAAAAAPVVTDAPTPVVSGPMMRKPELVDAVVAKTGMKKKDVKPVVEATLAVLGAALQDGRELNLQPMGKITVNREKKKATGKMLVARIRQSQDLPSEEANPDPRDMEDGAVPDTATAAE
ncbi:MAG: HU family DNA-binding protein [Pseudomonadota bacterium]